jgi:hypothetical protein
VCVSNCPDGHSPINGVDHIHTTFLLPANFLGHTMFGPIAHSLFGLFYCQGCAVSHWLAGPLEHVLLLVWNWPAPFNDIVRIALLMMSIFHIVCFVHFPF